MELQKAIDIVKAEINGPRFDHTLRVLKTAEQLTERFAYKNLKKVQLAAIFHDFAKLQSVESLRQMIMESDEDPQLLEYHAELWHGPACAYYLKKQQMIDDEEILDAIRFHTTGRANMTTLDKIIYLADYIEPARDFPQAEQVRWLASESLDAALKQALSNSIIFLVQKEVTIHPDTFLAYNDLILKKGE